MPAAKSPNLSTAFVRGLFLPFTQRNSTRLPALPAFPIRRTSSFHCRALSTGAPSFFAHPFLDQIVIAVPTLSHT